MGVSGLAANPYKQCGMCSLFFPKELIEVVGKRKVRACPGCKPTVALD